MQNGIATNANTTSGGRSQSFARKMHAAMAAPTEMINQTIAAMGYGSNENIENSRIAYAGNGAGKPTPGFMLCNPNGSGICSQANIGAAKYGLPPCERTAPAQ